MSSIPFVNPLPGVPSIESPFFDGVFADAKPTMRQIAQHLALHGFAVVKFPEAEFDAMADAIKSDLQPRYDAEQWTQHKDGLSNADLRLQDAWKYNQHVKKIACNPSILALLSRLYGKPAWPFQTLNYPVGTQQHFHTDAIHFHSVPERFMCGVWVALEDVTPESGPLLYYPGRHRWPVYSNEHMGVCASEMENKPTQNMYHSMWQALVNAHGIQPKQFLAKKGQAFIWTANLLHGGSLQTNKKATRWSQVSHYFFEDCAYYTPMISDPFYGRIHFRDLVNIETGAQMPQSYAGKPISKTFIAATNPNLGEMICDFQPDLYLAANPDVAKAGFNPYEHYIQYGLHENRRLRPATPDSLPAANWTPPAIPVETGHHLPYQSRQVDEMCCEKWLSELH